MAVHALLELTPFLVQVSCDLSPLRLAQDGRSIELEGNDNQDNEQSTGARKMIAVIFEVQIAEGQKQNYLDIAAELLPRLEQVDGFRYIERFQSLTNPEKLLSLSFFLEEEALHNRRNLIENRRAQRKRL